MTRVLLEKKRGGLVCRASGHAGFAKKGEDIVCAAVTILMRTAMETLSALAGLEMNAEAGAARGELGFAVDAASDEAGIKIDFLAEYLSNGFESLAREFPKNISFECKLEE